MDQFEPKFDVKTEAHAIARYVGPKDAISLGKLLLFFVREKWRGAVVINFPGNGGVQDVTFTEKKPAQYITDAK